ncbi:hypothetical protein [Cryobacterium sp. PAMC25264]|uniref:hypothetical protein n=1 Tax=Cryobacterium sp. PAMC25264 TaxID=2861288 RepID=UPI001C629EB2|nr:hypothetical protein [Cryobacterium sp. PAMC25264]QYF72468.1 hypothetical protein KY500_11545 [Cryobacterium sp. PAMC25264]
MSSEVLGGGVMVAVAAALWVTYLMPTWARRRQYLATERNAVRLQQTLRILAETSEIPQEVRVETNARGVSAQRKLLAQAEEDARIASKAAGDAATAARRAAVLRAAAARPKALTPAGKARRLRAMRALSTLLLLIGLVSAVAGLTLLSAGLWTLLVGGLVAAGTAVAALGRLASVSRSARAPRQATDAVATETGRRVPQGSRGQRFEPVHFEEAPVAAPTPWTPQPLPKPLHLSPGSIAQAAMASVDAAAQLRQAAAEAELQRRAQALAEAIAPSEVTPITRPVAARAAAAKASPQAAPSRFASMGIVGETEPGMTDLDDVLRRRRAVG